MKLKEILDVAHEDQEVLLKYAGKGIEADAGALAYTLKDEMLEREVRVVACECDVMGIWIEEDA